MTSCLTMQPFLCCTWVCLTKTWLIQRDTGNGVCVCVCVCVCFGYVVLLAVGWLNAAWGTQRCPPAKLCARGPRGGHVQVMAGVAWLGYVLAERWLNFATWGTQRCPSAKLCARGPRGGHEQVMAGVAWLSYVLVVLVVGTRRLWQALPGSVMCLWPSWWARAGYVLVGGASAAPNRFHHIYIYIYIYIYIEI